MGAKKATTPGVIIYAVRKLSAATGIDAWAGEQREGTEYDI